MTLTHFWYQVVSWVLIAQMITGFLKAFVGLCIPSIEYWLLDGFDLTPWKNDKKIPRNSESIYEADESEKPTERSFKERIRDFFKGFSHFKYKPLETDAQKHKGLAVFTLNLVVGVVLPIKFGLQLARLPLEPCIAACRRRWPLTPKIRRKSGPVQVVVMHDNNSDEITRRSRRSTLVSKPLHPEAEFMNLHNYGSNLVLEPVNTDPPITAQETVVKQPPIQENDYSRKTTPLVSSHASNPRSEFTQISNKSSQIVDNTNSFDVCARSQTVPIREQPLNEQTRNCTDNNFICTDEPNRVVAGDVSSDESLSENDSTDLCYSIQQNQKNVKSLFESRSTREVEFRSLGTEKQCLGRPMAESPAIKKSFQCRTEKDSEPRGQYFSRTQSTGTRSESVAALCGTYVEPRNSRMHAGFQPPEKGIQCVHSKEAENADQVWTRDDGCNPFTSEENRNQDVSVKGPPKRDSKLQVAFDYELEMIQSQPKCNTSKLKEKKHQSRHDSLRYRIRDDDSNTQRSNSERVNMAELRRKSNSSSQTLFEGATSQTHWQCFRGTTSTEVSWNSRTAAALVHSLDAVESGTLHMNRPEGRPADIVYSTADPDDQAVIDRITSPSGDQHDQQDDQLWDSTRVTNSSDTDSKVSHAQLPLSSESPKVDAVAQVLGPEKPLAFFTVSGEESKKIVPGAECQLGPNPFSDARTIPLSDGPTLASCSSAQPYSPQSLSTENLPAHYRSYVSLMPTVEEEYMENDSMTTRRIGRKRSSSGVKRVQNLVQNSQEISLCSRSSRMAHNTTSRAKSFKIVERNSAQMSRLTPESQFFLNLKKTPQDVFLANCVTESTSDERAAQQSRPARRPKPEKARKPSRKDAKANRKKMEGGRLPNENLRPSTSCTSQQSVMRSVLSTIALPLTVSSHANACVNTPHDLIVQPTPKAPKAPKATIKRSNSLPNHDAQPSVAQFVNRAISEPNVTSTFTGTENDVSPLFLLIKWSKEYYSRNKTPVVYPAVTETVQLPLVEVRSKELVVRHMSEDVETVVRNYSENSELDYCPPFKVPSGDRFEVTNHEEKGNKLPYEVEALIHRPLLENVGVLPEPYDPCSIDEIMFLRRTTKPPLKTEVNVEAVMGSRSSSSSRQSFLQQRSSPRVSFPRSTPRRVPLSPYLPELLPLPDPNNISQYLPHSSETNLLSNPHNAATTGNNHLPPTLGHLKSVLDDIESELRQPFQNRWRRRFSGAMTNFTTPSPAPPSLSPPLSTRVYFPHYPSYVPWDSNQQYNIPGPISSPNLPERSINRPFAMDIPLNQPGSGTPSRSTLWNGLDTLYQYPNELLKSSSDFKELGSKNTETHPNVKHFESVLSPSVSSFYPDQRSTKSDNVARTTLLPTVESPIRPIIPTLESKRTGSPAPWMSFNHLQIPSSSPPMRYIDPLNVLAGLNMATKRAEELLSHRSPVSVMRSNTNKFAQAGPPQTSSHQIENRTSETCNTNRSESPFTSPIICLTSEVEKQTNFVVPTPSRNSRTGSSRYLAPPSQGVTSTVTPPSLATVEVPAWPKQDTAAERNELPLENTKNSFAETSQNPTSNLLGKLLKETEQLPSSITNATTARDSNRSLALDTSTVPVPVGRMPTDDPTDIESRKLATFNYKQIHEREMLQMREHMNSKLALYTPSCNATNSSNVKLFTDSSRPSTSEKLALTSTPVRALMPAPQTQEGSSAETGQTSKTERSHKNLSSLLERELNIDSSSTQTHRNSCFRKRKGRSVLPSPSDTSHHKPSRRKPATARATWHDGTERIRHHQPVVTRMKGPIKVKVKCTRSFSYFTVKERYNMLVPATSSSNSDCR